LVTRSTVAPTGSLPSANAVAGGGAHTCASTTLGFLACWGNNDSGQLGSTATSPDTSPTVVSGL
jgi:alpha-tubulin suppressor-like RCC1 family protein